MIGAEGFETLVTHVFVAGDQYLDSDVVFGVKESLICEFAKMPAGEAPGRNMAGPYYRLDYDFTLKRRDRPQRHLEADHALNEA